MKTNPEANKYSEMSFSEAFKANRDANMAAHGMNYSKWTNFMWPGSRSDSPDGKLTEYHPYRTSDLKKGAKKNGSVKFEKEIFKNINEVQNLVESNKIDATSKESINTLMNSMIEKASNLKLFKVHFNKNHMAKLHSKMMTVTIISVFKTSNKLLFNTYSYCT